MTRIWYAILDKCGITYSSSDWMSIVNWMAQFNCDSLCHLLARLSFAAAVYFIWRERNARLHNEPPRPPSILLYDIFFSVRTRTNLLRGVKPSYDNKWLHLSWQLSDDIF